MHFADFSNLFLLIPVSVIWYISVRRRYLVRDSRWWLIFSFVSILLLVIAFSQPYCRLSQKPAIRDIVLIDVSSSISPGELAGLIDTISDQLTENISSDQISFFAFARDVVPLENWQVSSLVQAREYRTGVFSQILASFFESSDLEKAIFSVIALYKGDFRLHLFSDCHETSGDLAGLIPALDDYNIQIYPVLPETVSDRELILKYAKIDNVLPPDSVADISLAVESDCAGEVLVSIKTPEFEVIDSFRVELEPGVSYFSIPVQIANTVGSYLNLVVDIDSDFDSDLTNNRFYLSTRVSQLPRLLLAGVSDEFLEQFIRLFDGKARVSLFNSDEDLKLTDLLIVSNISHEISLPDWRKVKERVNDGMGFLMIPAGEMVNLDQGLWSGIQDLFPVTIVHDSKREDPDTAVVFIVDTSGSMFDEQLALAREVIRQCQARMSNNDYIGIVEFYSAKRWAAILQSASNYIEINRALNKLTPGGGTILGPSIEEAHYALLNNQSAIKHIVIITDGGVEKDDYKTVVEQLKNDDISLSTILVGPATHVGFMAEMARWGNGRFFHIRDRLLVPGINLKETLSRSASAIFDDVSVISSVFPYQVLDSVDIDSIDKEMNYIKVILRSPAQSVLDIGSGRSLLSFWNYGAGISAFSSSDMFSRNLSDLQTAQLLKNLCYWLSLPENSSGPKLEYSILKDSIILNYVDYENDQEQTHLSWHKLSVAGQGLSQVQSMYPISENTWQSKITPSDSGIYRVSLDYLADIVPDRYIAYNKPFEKPSFDNNNLLAQNLARANKVDLSSSQSKPVVKDISNWFIGLSLLFFLMSIIARRLPANSVSVKAITNNRHLPLIILVMCLFSIPEPACGSLDQLRADSISAALDGLADSPEYELFDSSVNFNILSFICGDYENVIYHNGQDYPDQLLAGFGFYARGEFISAYDVFVDIAAKYSDQSIGKYAFSWAILSAEKCQRIQELIDFAIDDPEIATGCIDPLVFLLASRHDRASLIDLYNTLDTSHYQESKALSVAKEQTLIALLSLSSLEQIGFELDRYDSYDLARAVLYNLLRYSKSDQVSKVISEIIASINSQEELLRLARLLGQDYSFFDLANIAIDRAIAIDPQAAFGAAILQSKLLVLKNDKKAAIDLLNSIYVSDLNSEQLLNLAYEYELLGEAGKVKQVLKVIYSQDGSVDDMIEFAELASNYSDPASLFEYWLSLWQSCSEDYLLYSIEPELLDVASQTGNMVRLMLYLEKQISDNIDRDKSILLLVSIYESLGDPTGIIALVEQYYGSDTLDSLLIQNRIYFRTRQYSFCFNILEKLMTIDPDNSEDYLYQMAMMALDSNNPYGVYHVIELIDEYASANLASNEFIGGIYLILDDNEKAMKYFELALQSPQSSESIWLYWSQSSLEVGKVDIAISRLLELIGSDCSDSLLCTAVDSLIKIKADKVVMKQVLSHIVYNIASEPEKIFLYQLALDIIDYLEIKSGLAYRIRLLAANYSSEHRRLLYSDLSGNLKPDPDFDSEQIIIMPLLLGYQIPYDSLIHIAHILLKDFSSDLREFYIVNYIIPQVRESDLLELVEYFQRQGLFYEAADILTCARAVHVNSVVILIAAGEHNEIIGNIDQAYSCYFEAYSRLVQDAAYELKSDNVSSLYSFNSDARNRAIALVGMLDTGQNDDFTRLIEYLDNLTGDFDFAGIANRDELDIILSIWLDYDRITLATGMVELSDDMRERLSKFVKPDLPFYKRLLKNRVDYGYLPEYIIDDPDLAVNVAIDILTAGDYTGTNAAALVPDIIASIESQNLTLALELVSKAVRQKSIVDLDTCYELLTACAIIDRRDLVADIVLNCTRNYVVNLPRGQRADTFAGVCYAANMLLTHSELVSLSNILKGYFADDPQINHYLELISLELDDRSSYPADTAELMLHSSLPYSTLAEIVRVTQPNQRIALFTKAFNSVDNTNKTFYITNYFRSLDYQVTGSELDGYCDIIGNLTSFTLSSYAYQYLIRFADEASLNMALVKALADRAIILEPESMAFRAFNIMVLASFDNSQAEQRAVALLDDLAIIDQIDSDFCFIVRGMIQILSHEQLRGYFQKLNSLESSALSSAQMLIFCELALGLGNISQAENLAIECFKLLPSNRAVMDFTLENLQMIGRSDLMVALLTDYLKSDLENTYYWRSLFKLACDVGDFSVAASALKHDQTAMFDINSIYLASISGDDQKLRQLLSLTVIHCRREQIHYSFLWRNWQKPGGITQFLEQEKGSQSMYSVLAQTQAARPDLERYFRYMSKTNSNYTDFAVGLESLAATSDQQKYWQLVRVLLSGSDYDLSLVEGAKLTAGQTDTICRIIATDHNRVFDSERSTLVLAVLGNISRDRAQEYINVMGLNHRINSPSLAVELLKHYMAVNNWPEFQNTLDQLLCKSYYKINQPVYANLFKFSSVDSEYSSTFIESAIELIVSSFSRPDTDKQAAIAYLSMLAVVRSDLKMPTEKTINQIENLVGNIPARQLWLLDCLIMCGYQDRADKLTQKMVTQKTLPFARRNNKY